MIVRIANKGIRRRLWHARQAEVDLDAGVVICGRSAYKASVEDALRVSFAAVTYKNVADPLLAPIKNTEPKKQKTKINLQLKFPFYK